MSRINSLLFYLTTLLVCAATGCQVSTSTSDSLDNTSLDTVATTTIPVVSCLYVKRSVFPLTVTSNGLIRTSAQSRLSFRINGTIKECLVHNSSTVTAGQVLARLDDQDQRLALRVAQDQLAESNVQLRALIAEYGSSGLDTSKLSPNARAFVLTKSGYYKAYTALRLASQQLEYTQLKAPYSGIIANLTAKPYNFITSYEPFCVLLSRHDLLVEFSVLESELATVKVGQIARISTISSPNRIYLGHVKEINPFVNSQGLVLVKARIESTDSNLFEGMNVNITIERQLKNQLVIPKSAVVERSGRKVVFRIEESKAKWCFVTVSHENDMGVSISEGLKPGDLIVASGNLNLAHDSPVSVKQESANL